MTYSIREQLTLLMLLVQVISSSCIGNDKYITYTSFLRYQILFFLDSIRLCLWKEGSRHSCLICLLKLCSFANSKCQEAIDSMASVPFCPKSQEEWESAAKIKNCNITASQQTCTNADEFVYHCVIDGFQNETLEVCAPRKLIYGNILTTIVLKILNFWN